MRGYKCNCIWVGATAMQFLKHISECPQVAPWIREWAIEMIIKPDWKSRVGLG